MDSMCAVAVGAILFAVVLLAVGAALVWQWARVGHREPAALYLVDEAAAFVLAALPSETADRLGEEGVASILEWSNYHSQVVVARSGVDVPVLGGPAAVSFVLERAAASGRPCEEEDVTAVLAAEAAYLVSIGAVGEPVEEGSP
jgi:hypothetical protein